MISCLGSAGCQSATGRIRRGEPVLFGNLPKSSLHACNQSGLAARYGGSPASRRSLRRRFALHSCLAAHRLHYGRGLGVSRGRGVGACLGVDVGVAVGVTVGVAVAVGVGVGVGVGDAGTIAYA